MEQKGFVLKKPEINAWQWDIWIDKIYQHVQLYDTKGRIYLIIGRGEKHWQGYALLTYIESPRTTKEQWRYGLFERDGIGKEELFRNIFEDCRDILEKFCDTIIKECVDDIKNKVPNQQHYQRFLKEFDTLSVEYYQKLQLQDKDAFEALEIVKQLVETLRNRPIEEVETDLLGAVAAYEKKLMELYGGVRGTNEMVNSCYIKGIGKNKRTLNMLVDICFAWKTGTTWDNIKCEMEMLEK